MMTPLAIAAKIQLLFLFGQAVIAIQQHCQPTPCIGHRCTCTSFSQTSFCGQGLPRTHGGTPLKKDSL